jgi:hypothetical protein
LEQLLDRLAEAGGQGDRVTLGKMIEVVGQRSFGPLLLVAGLMAFSPLSGIPGMPTMVAIIVLLIAGQFLINRKHFWLPSWLLRRGVSRQKFEKGLRFVRKPARWVDRLLRPRLTGLTHKSGLIVIAALCTINALFMPAMEFLPFAATVVGAALTAFGLSVITHDGLLALVALAFTATTAGMVVHYLF